MAPNDEGIHHPKFIYGESGTPAQSGSASEAQPQANKDNSQNSILITQSAVIERGWTKGEIKRFLGEPDLHQRNPKYACAAPMRLYSVDKVVAAETSPEYIEAHERSKRRRLGALTAVETRTKQLMKAVQGIKIGIPMLSRDELLDAAIEHYNSRSSDFVAHKNADEDFLDRITVNYLRHECTRYDYNTTKMCGKVGKSQGLELLRERIYEQIAETYPHLAGECERQQAVRSMVA